MHACVHACVRGYVWAVGGVTEYCWVSISYGDVRGLSQASNVYEEQFLSTTVPLGKEADNIRDAGVGGMHEMA